MTARADVPAIRRMGVTRVVALVVGGFWVCLPSFLFALVPNEIAWAVHRMAIGSFI